MQICKVTGPSSSNASTAAGWLRRKCCLSDVSTGYIGWSSCHSGLYLNLPKQHVNVLKMHSWGGWGNSANNGAVPVVILPFRWYAAVAITALVIRAGSLLQTNVGSRHVYHPSNTHANTAMLEQKCVRGSVLPAPEPVSATAYEVAYNTRLGQACPAASQPTAVGSKQPQLWHLSASWHFQTFLASLATYLIQHGHTWDADTLPQGHSRPAIRASMTVAF
jgi:hypothetical protein